MVKPPPRVLDLLGTLIRLGLAAVWLFASVPKLADINQNYLAVRAYEVFPDSVSRVVGGVQPFVEAALGVLLLVGLGVRVVGIISAVVLVLFIAGIVQAWARGLAIDCGCFSSGGQVAPGETQYSLDLARDVVFLVMAGWLIVRPRTLFAVDSALLGRGTRT